MLVNNVKTQIETMRRKNKKPKYLIVNEAVYYQEIVTDTENFIPSCETRNIDGDRYLGLKVTILIDVPKHTVRVR